MEQDLRREIAAEIREIKDLSSERLLRMYEFVVLTVLSYQRFMETARDNMTALDQFAGLHLTGTEIKSRIDDYRKTYIMEIGLQFFVSCFESWFYDLLTAVLRDPKKMKQERTITLETLLACGEMDRAIAHMVNKELNDLTYQNVRKWFEYLDKRVSLDSPMVHINYDWIIEMKAARDIFVHNNGVINDVYLDKVGAQARGKRGDRLRVESAYFNKSFAVVKQIIASVSDHVADTLDPDVTVEMVATAR